MQLQQGPTTCHGFPCATVRWGWRCAGLPLHMQSMASGRLRWVQRLLGHPLFVCGGVGPDGCIYLKMHLGLKSGRFVRQ